MTYTPKLSHAITTTLLMILFAYLWGEYGADAFKFGAVMFGAITVSIMVALLEGSHYHSVTAYIEALVKMDSDLRNALAFNVPSLRLIAKRGQVQTLFADTKASAEHIRLFLADSNQATTASKRDWHTSQRPRWAWDEIYGYLLERGMIGAYSTGNESYPWRGSAYQNLCVYFLAADVPDLNAIYASEAPSPADLTSPTDDI